MTFSQKTPDINPKIPQDYPGIKAMASDKRNPNPPAARKIVDKALFDLSNQQRHLAKIMEGGLNEAEIYRRVGLALVYCFNSIQALRDAEMIGNPKFDSINKDQKGDEDGRN